MLVVPYLPWTLSPYLFTLCVEILASTIRQDKNIEETEYKMPQYADDTEIIFDGEKIYLKKLLKPSTPLEKKSGLFLNVGKTSATWLGSR